MTQVETQAGSSAHALRCMEIWGGNTAARQPVSVPGMDGFVYSSPYRGEAAGGDVHYVSMCAQGNIARFVVADVSGHGAEVAAAAAALRGLMRKSINTLDQRRFARALNRLFAAGEEGAGKFATALLATYHAPSEHLIVCNAGHPRPFLWRAAEGRWVMLELDAAAVSGVSGAGQGPGNLPLGIIDPTPYSQFAVRLSEGDVLVVYTDGCSEARGADGAMVGEGGVRAALERLPTVDPEALVAGLVGALFPGGGTLGKGGGAGDDVTVLALRHNATKPPRQSLAERIRVAGKVIGLVR